MRREVVCEDKFCECLNVLVLVPVSNLAFRFCRFFWSYGRDRFFGPPYPQFAMLFEQFAIVPLQAAELFEQSVVLVAPVLYAFGGFAEFLEPSGVLFPAVDDHVVELGALDIELSDLALQVCDRLGGVGGGGQVGAGAVFAIAVGLGHQFQRDHANPQSFASLPSTWLEHKTCDVPTGALPL